MNKIYKKNMQYLKELNLDLYNKISEVDINTVEVIKAKDNSDTLIKKNGNGYISIHSRYNTKTQARTICEYALNDNSDIIFIIGMGLGYETREIVKNSNGKRCFIIEPDSEIFKVALNSIDIKTIFNNNNNIHFMLGDNGEDISNFFYNLVQSEKTVNVKFVILPAYEILYSELIIKLIKDMRKILNLHRVNIHTKLSSHRPWLQSYIINLKYLKETCPITKLHSKFENIPAIIVGAGPSLNYNLEHLKKVCNKAIIAPVGTGVKVLDNNNIKGHLLGAIDTWISEEKLFKNLKLNKDSALMYSTMVCHTVPDLFNRNKFLMNTTVMDHFISDKLLWEKYNLFSGPSVANSIVYNLARLGCNPIILLGQDYCFSNGKNYADSADDFKDMSSEFEKDGYIKTKNAKGEDVYTDPAFLATRQSVEFCIRLNSNIKFLNGNSLGLNIEGAENIDFNEYVDNILSKGKEYNIESIIDECYKEHVLNADNDLIDEFIKVVGRDIDNVIKICKDLIRILESSSSEKYKLDYLKEKQKEFNEIELYKYIIRDVVESAEHIYSKKNKIEKELSIYCYALDKLLIMENAYRYEILKGESDEY
ncbi:6-hydroxymethylpterin diphosphokinase MptE-like protein [Clostridium sp. CMCC3677]|uniref:motility associated factor glycosyltransferase family protein n=1 Tax=Clostridium sp. CMCC3677 TaxID=2949963 RepID=UPI0013F050F9|nr:6-hydroxymethylpterin diphosphokinase MptE-like protein [Clostridium sp. CMCC3677]NFG60645.1 motility associated factor glycosyltransferase family protein [Clostridium botulinum]NFQ10569.1 motility associated factor glycosyltransferase family protein [Clostridium botulinum]